MAIFNTYLKQLNYDNPTAALMQMANHIRQIQEELEYAIVHLDSTNISEITLGKTHVVTPSGSEFYGERFVIDCGTWD